ncbi:hypothetical protein V2J09_021504 [Rumex salicifolius]
MDSPVRSRSYVKRGMEEGSDGKNGKAVADEDYPGHEKSKSKSRKSRKSSYGDDMDGWDGDRRRSSGDRNEHRKRVGGSSKEYSDEDDYGTRKESYSDKIKMKQEQSTLEKLSNWYGDRDLENKHDGGDKSGGRAHRRLDESEKTIARKTAAKSADAEGSQGRSKIKDGRLHDVEHERATEKDPKFSDRSEQSKAKLHGSSKHGTRRLDDSDTAKIQDETNHLARTDSRSGKNQDPVNENIRERSAFKLETIESKSKALESCIEKDRSSSREEKSSDADRIKSRSRYDSVEEDFKDGSVNRDEAAGREKSHKHRENRATDNTALESRERSLNPEEDGLRDRSGREIGHSRSSRTPEKSGRNRHESHIPDVDLDRSGSLKRKEADKEVHKDDRVKARDDNWGDRNRDREGSRENWKRTQPSSNDRDGDVVYDRDREWELPKRGRDRAENERPSGRIGNRKDGRGEIVKASSNFGISTENYDVIEIQRKPLDSAKEDRFPRNNDMAQPELKSVLNDARDDRHMAAAQGPASTGDASKEKYMEDGVALPDQGISKDDWDGQGGRSRGQKVATSSRLSTGQSSRSGSLPPVVNEEQGSQGRSFQQGMKGGRPGRTNRIRPSVRDNQQTNIPVHLMGPPFGPLSLPPPGQLQQLNPGMSPAPIPPGVFLSPFPPPVWPGARGLDMSILPISSGVSPIVPGLPGQRFGPNMGTPNPIMFFNQSGPGGMPSNASESGFNSMVPHGRGQSHEKASGSWAPPKSNGPPGKAPSRGEQNDYSQNFVDTGMRPQNFIRELELSNVEDYPKLRELIQKKDEIVAKAASAPMYYKCDLQDFVLSPEFFGTKFDVILVDPPWEEYVHRAPGVTDNMESWNVEQIMNLKIEAIADTPSFIFLWVGDGVGLEQGRQCLKKWGFRRCEDICWVKTNKNTATPALRHDSHTLFQHTKEHCLMGIKGTVRRSTDGHIIHANIDTDVIIAEEPPYGSTAKPDEIYRIIEHFALGCRRIELFGEDHNIRSGWLTLGKGLSSSNFNSEAYTRTFSDKDGKVWQGGGGRNPPPEAPHLVLTTPEIESLRPKSPMKNQQQMQQQSSSSISLTANSSNRKPAGNSPHTPNQFGVSQEGSNDHPPPWAPNPFGPRDNAFDVYGYGMPPPVLPLPNREFMDFDPQRTMNNMM